MARFGLSGFSALLFLICALLPLSQVLSDGTPRDASRGVEVGAALAQSSRSPVPDAATRVSAGTVDLDDVYEDALPPRLVPRATLTARHPLSPASIGGIGATGGSPLDRPPRPATFG